MATKNLNRVIIQLIEGDDGGPRLEAIGSYSIEELTGSKTVTLSESDCSAVLAAGRAALVAALEDGGHTVVDATS